MLEALTAEALIDLRPWGQWTPDGRPQPGTEEVLDILNDVLDKSPTHILALHLFIHAMENSRHPELASGAADRLRILTPGIEHLLHMPSHIDIQCGNRHKALEANQAAINANTRYRQLAVEEEQYSIQMAHNHHMLIYVSMMIGNKGLALRTDADMVASIPGAFAERYALSIDGYFAIHYEVKLRFGLWESILGEPSPPGNFPLTTVLLALCPRSGVRCDHKGRTGEERTATVFGSQKYVPKKTEFHGAPASELLAVAESMLAGEILYRERKVNESVTALKHAVQVEDQLKYSEPPVWMLPVRQALGGVLIDSGRYAEAEQVYREDLVRHPENGWSLFGLATSLRLQAKTAEALPITSRFQMAWKDSDFRILSSCCCLPTK